MAFSLIACAQARQKYRLAEIFRPHMHTAAPAPAPLRRKSEMSTTYSGCGWVISQLPKTMYSSSAVPALAATFGTAV